MEWFARMVER